MLHGNGWQAHLTKNEFFAKYEVVPGGITVLGLRGSGFRQIPREQEEWAGEVAPEQLEALAAETRASAPDIVLTHACPDGVLATPTASHFGLPGLVGTSARFHFFGHEHATGGRTEQLGDTTYVNGACHLRIHEVRPHRA